MNLVGIIFKWLLFCIPVFGLFSLIYVFSKQELSNRQRVFHHFIGSLNFILFLILIAGYLISFMIMKYKIDIVFMSIFAICSIIGFLVNLRTRGRI